MIGANKSLYLAHRQGRPNSFSDTQLIAQGPGTPQEPHNGALDSLKLPVEASPLDLAAKVEMSFSTFAPPQCGQSGSHGLLLKASSSKR